MVHFVQNHLPTIIPHKFLFFITITSLYSEGYQNTVTQEMIFIGRALMKYVEKTKPITYRCCGFCFLMDKSND